MMQNEMLFIGLIIATLAVSYVLGYIISYPMETRFIICAFVLTVLHLTLITYTCIVFVDISDVFYIQFVMFLDLLTLYFPVKFLYITLD